MSQDAKQSRGRRSDRRRRRQERPLPQKLEAQEADKLSIAEQFCEVARSEIRTEIDGKSVRMTLWEAYVRTVHTKALNKDHSAARLVDQLRRQFPADLPCDRPIFILSEADAHL